MSNLPVNTLLQGGKYRIVRFIGSGGFGCTYEAKHVLFESRVAIKEFFVKDFCNRDEGTAHVSVGTTSKKSLAEKLRGKFVDEAKALYKLQHSGIVHVSDVFEENGTAYYVMDYIDGPSLADLLKREGPLTEVRALGYIRQVCEALQYVHSCNRLHLDIKPANIMVDGSDRAILIDFGVSKQYDECGGENTSTLLGSTPGYAPPEQGSHNMKKFCPATDIYALGATLYKLLTGVTPTEASSRSSGDELSPLPERVSASTRRAVFAAMEMDKKKRPQSVAEFLVILDGNADSDFEGTDIDEDETNGTSTDGTETNPGPVSQDPVPVVKSIIGRYVAIAACVVGVIVGIEFMENRPKPAGPASRRVSDTVPPPQPDTLFTIEPLKLLRVSGTVTDETTGGPIAGVQVKSSDGKTVTTDGDGKYSFAEGVEENAQLRVFYDSKKWKTRTVTKAGTYDFKLQLSVTSEPAPLPAPPQLVLVSGTVTNTKGKPVAGAQVKSSDGKTVTTDGDGKYLFAEGVEENAQLSVVYDSKTWLTHEVTEAGTYDFKLPLPTLVEPLPAPPTPVNPASGESSNDMVMVISSKINGHEYVDLGLSVKWATCNVGATSQSDYGDYYAWGEISPKPEFTKQNSKTYKKKYGDISGDARYDAARANWGGSWRLPTKSELEELKNKCTWTWTTMNEVCGYKVIGKNGNSIFLPAAGDRHKKSLDNTGSRGYYWGATPVESNSEGASGFHFENGSCKVGWFGRFDGFSVRPVSK